MLRMVLTVIAVVALCLSAVDAEAGCKGKRSGCGGGKIKHKVKKVKSESCCGVSSTAVVSTVGCVGCCGRTAVVSSSTVTAASATTALVPAPTTLKAAPKPSGK